jgi:arabinofuranosyltransferase
MSAWLCDDALIVYATAKQYLNGNGLCYNVNERVQSFTSMIGLFTYILVSMVTGEGFFSALIINFVTSIAAIIIFSFYMCDRIYKDNPFSHVAILPLLILITSKIFIEYSTSGLENSILFLFIIIFIKFLLNNQEWDYKQLRKFSFISSLLLLTRHDMAIIIFLPLIYIFFSKRKIKFLLALLAGLVGMIPFIFWEIFSLFYYGFLFPNTMYAKLNSGIPNIEYFLQGISYFFASLVFDPIAIFSILVVVSITIINFIVNKDNKSNNKILFIISISIIFYCLYILRIGGCFMAGRFYYIPIILSAILLSHIRLERYILNLTLIIILFFSFIQQNSILKINQVVYGVQNSKNRIFHGIADEHKVYFNRYGLIFYGKEQYNNNTELIIYDPPVFGQMGYIRNWTSLDSHIVDFVALTDPLLARLPSIYNPEWRIGHLSRRIPEGYLETIKKGENLIQDAKLAKYYDILSNITRGDLFSFKRIINIINININLYNNLIDFDYYRYPNLSRKTIEVSIDKISTRKFTGYPSDGNGNIIIESGTTLTIKLNDIHYNRIINFSKDGDSVYDIAFLLNGKCVTMKTHGISNFRAIGLNETYLKLSKADVKQGYDTIIFIPTNDKDKHYIGHVILKDY